MNFNNLTPLVVPSKSTSAVERPSCPSKNFLKLLTFNTRSCRNITTEIHDLIEEEALDIVLLTETWLCESGDEVHITDMTPKGYQYCSFSRTGQSSRSGGGIGVMYRDSLSDVITMRSVTGFDAIEAVDIQISGNDTSASIVCVYRRPPRKTKRLTITNKMFFDEFPKFLAQYNNVRRNLFLTGDFNFHFEKNTSSEVNRFKTMLSDHNLVQLIDRPTHEGGHTLDLFVVRAGSHAFTLDRVQDLGLSDHCGIFSNLAFKRPRRPKRTVSSRNLRAINSADFRADVESFAEKVSKQSDSTDVSHLVDMYNTDLREVMDRHAPLVTRQVTDRSSAPWVTEEIHEERRQLRKAERKWRESELTVHREIFVTHRRRVKSLVRAAKRQHYCDKVASCTTSRKLFMVSNELLGKSKSTPLPTDTPRSELPNRFGHFFNEKIQKIRDDLDATPCEVPTYSVYDGPQLHMFEAVSQEFVLKLVKDSAAKSCSLDPIPTSFTKQYLEELVPLITQIVNASLLTGTVPSQLKQAVVTPLLKKSGLDPNTLKNFRPVSNLPFISKILEKAVLSQLQTHLVANNLNEVEQSAYRKNHSTETALLHVLEGLLVRADEKLVSVLALLDLSAAFDTIDHDILLTRLNKTFGISGCALQWFASYLYGRMQAISIDGCLSDNVALKYGVPQGSVLGPILFTLYIQPLSDMIHSHACDHHKYADDTQVSKGAPVSDFQSVLSNVESCIEDIVSWMQSNKLKLNADKTEVLPVGSDAQVRLVKQDSATIVGKPVTFKSSVRDLGIYIDQTLSMKEHVSHLCRATYLEMRRISLMRPYLTQNATAQLVVSFILSRLDYCNSILAGLPSCLTDRLQKIQNNAARLVMQKSKKDHVTPLLRKLHWLPVIFRSKFKIAVLAYRFFHDSLPPYLSRLLTHYQPPRNLRSTSENFLKVPRRKLKTFGERSFSYQAPVIWNALPSEVRSAPSLASFKSRLKTYYFVQAFGP